MFSQTCLSEYLRINEVARDFPLEQYLESLENIHQRALTLTNLCRSCVSVTSGSDSYVKSECLNLSADQLRLAPVSSD